MKFDFSEYGVNVEKDKAPDWMHSMLDNNGSYNTGKEKIDFSKLFENSTNNKVRKCSCCGNILKPNEVGKCSYCLKNF